MNAGRVTDAPLVGAKYLHSYLRIVSFRMNDSPTVPPSRLHCSYYESCLIMMLYVYLREKATVWRMMLGVTRDAAANHRATPMGRTRYKCLSLNSSMKDDMYQNLAPAGHSNLERK